MLNKVNDTGGTGNRKTCVEIPSFKDDSKSGRLKQNEKIPNVFKNILGQNRKMIEIFRQIINVAEYDYPVLISGETGTGKELVAKAIHEESHRKALPFVPINCAALPEGLIESELFGHVKGAFSGAVRDKRGRFEIADGGTILLDEVADLYKSAQIKLLRFLEDGKFEKVGGEKTVSVNVKVISATNKDLKKQVKKESFREDLYYRLNVLPIHLPPLRERKNDIPLLVNHFLEQAARKYNRAPFIVSDEAMLLLVEYEWPGNVRELQNAVQFAFVKCHDVELTPDNLPMELKDKRIHWAGCGSSTKLDIFLVKTTLEKTGGNKAKTARHLGVGRATLYRFLEDYPAIQKSICV
ncbi:MAG: sigma-54 dependent transcriptional regulator [Desulfobacteraceae bacterium]|nr:sigma-54 dependent transcriptional regulator [Desulfobacteraceae bacterium]MDH3574073.1 sigma-54 dependent transcriptional regulator [Desulfobacteraceae bacterium]MDH3722846.1 sigma-54 dependent transcriptional regulator [Desulfobacteraceae bacterium]MDH3836720.1 sigma-54 dependent transcriptional regulator [Desulfobacteraceae bacterium]MDH3875537.1 sigma-54 dependent transcriptional regulator [Desulfobacteraceae bacterium]